MVSLNEELLSVAEAARVLPGHPNVATVWRWISKGCRGIRLEVFRCGGRTYTSREALERFAARLSGRDEPDGTPFLAADSRPKPSPARKRAIDGARAQLEAAGIL